PPCFRQGRPQKRRRATDYESADIALPPRGREARTGRARSRHGERGRWRGRCAAPTGCSPRKRKSRLPLNAGVTRHRADLTAGGERASGEWAKDAAPSHATRRYERMRTEKGGCGSQSLHHQVALLGGNDPLNAHFVAGDGVNVHKKA